MKSKKERLDLKQDNDKAKQSQKKKKKRLKMTEMNKNLSITRSKSQSNLEKRVQRREGKSSSGTHGKASHFVPMLCL